MRRAVCAALALMLVLGLAACGGNGGSAAGPVELGESLVARAENLPDMTCVSSEGKDATGAELFPYLSDMDYSKVAGYYLAYSTAGSAEEIAVIRVKDAAALPEAKASLERHLENRAGLFRTYDSEQAAMLGKAEIVAAGDTAALIICENASELASALRGEING